MTNYKTSPGKFNFKKVLKPILIVLSVMAIIIICYYGAMRIAYKGEAKESAKTTIVGGNKVVEKKITVLKYTEDLNIGDAVTELKVIPEEMMESQVPANAIRSIGDLKSKRLKAKVFKNEYVLSEDLVDVSMWYEESDRLVEHIFAEGAVPAFIKEGSLIDIKQFKVGDVDPFVIAKAVVVSRNGNTLSMLLNAVEQEYLKESAAEGNLFIVQYGDSYQEASPVTYTPNYADKQKALNLKEQLQNKPAQGKDNEFLNPSSNQ